MTAPRPIYAPAHGPTLDSLAVAGELEQSLDCVEKVLVQARMAVRSREENVQIKEASLGKEHRSTRTARATLTKGIKRVAALERSRDVLRGVIAGFREGRNPRA